MAFKPLSEKINVQMLISNFNKLREEYLKCQDADFFDMVNAEPPQSELEFFLEKVRSGKKNDNHQWQWIPLIWNGEIFEGNPDHIKQSDTIKILLNLGITPMMAVYSRMAPGTVLDPHHDLDDVVFGESPMPEDINNHDAGLIKYHFALDVPLNGKCGVKVLNEEKIIQNKDLYSFDENMTHSAYNLSDESRGVLIFSFRKDLL